VFFETTRGFFARVCASERVKRRVIHVRSEIRTFDQNHATVPFRKESKESFFASFCLERRKKEKEIFWEDFLGTRMMDTSLSERKRRARNVKDL